MNLNRKFKRRNSKFLYCPHCHSKITLKKVFPDGMEYEICDKCGWERRIHK